MAPPIDFNAGNGFRDPRFIGGPVFAGPGSDQFKDKNQGGSGQPIRQQIGQGNAPGINQNGLNADQLANGGSGGTGSGSYSIDKIIDATLAQWDKDRAANVGRYNEATKDSKGDIARYDADPRVQGSQKLVGDLLANPEALNDATMQKIRNQVMNGITSQGRNAFKQQSGILMAGGNADPSTLAAAAAAQARQDQAQKTGANTQLEIQRANQRNADIQGAIKAGQTQSMQDISVPMGTHKNILDNLLIERSPDVAGLGMMGLMQQMMQNAGLHTPGSTATKKVGGKGPQQDGGLITQTPGGGRDTGGDVNGNPPDWW